MNIRHILCAIFLFLSAAQINAQSNKASKQAQNKIPVVTAKVNRQVELLSIVARLADYDEYVRDDFKAYAEDVDKYFAKYKQHPAIQFARKVRESNEIGFDAVASMAVHLNSDLTPKIPFSKGAPDERWGKRDAEEFAGLLQRFYKDAECEIFFNSHAEMYKLAERRFQTILDKVDFKWYKNFYGELPHGTFNLYIGLLIGGMNFGPKVIHPNRKEDLFAIIGTSEVDEKGLPIYTEDFLPTIIHEFNHSFINYLVSAREKQFLPAGEKIYQPVSERMKRMAYGGGKIMIIESLVRAAVIRYLFAHQQTGKAYAAIINERNNGFLWMDELFALVGVFENARKTYPTFRDFIPMVEAYYLDLANHIDHKSKSFDLMKPRVIAIDAFANGAQDVDPNLTKITITFDRPLKGHSINYGKSGKEHYPVEKIVGYNENGTKFTMQVKLKPDWEYDFVLTGLGFRSNDSYPLQEYVVTFKTKK
jgi:hypothetical protein